MGRVVGYLVGEMPSIYLLLIVWLSLTHLGFVQRTCCVKNISHNHLPWWVIHATWSWCVNPELFWGFVWFLNSEMGQVVDIIPHGRQGPVCLIHPGVRDKCRVSEIDLSQSRHETAFWWRHNEPVTSQWTDRIKWPNYPVELIGIYVHINTHNKESLTQRCRRSTNVRLCLIFLYISIWFES